MFPTKNCLHRNTFHRIGRKQSNVKVITISESVDQRMQPEPPEVWPQVAGVEQFGIHIMSLLKALVIWVTQNLKA